VEGRGRPEVDLSVRRDLGDLISTAFAIFGRHFTVFFTLTLMVVAPVVLLVDGVWGRQLAEGADATVEAGPGITSVLLAGLVIPSLVTALHVRIVEGLARGEQPTIGSAFAAVRDRLPAVFGAVLLYTLAVGLGFVALVIPGIWLSVRLYFGAQFAVVDGLGPADALRASFEQTRGRWWRLFGYLFVIGLIVGVAASVLTAIAGAAGDGVVYVVVAILVQAVGLSISALFGTLLFFDLRTRSAELIP
jgi:hypothetical protein